MGLNILEYSEHNLIICKKKNNNNKKDYQCVTNFSSKCISRTDAQNCMKLYI